MALGLTRRGMKATEAALDGRFPPPTAVVGLSGVVELAAGGYHSCARLTDGSVSCWGNNGLGQLGDGTLVDKLSPTAVAGLSGVAGLAASDYHTCGRIAADGSVRCWGANGFGQLGDGTVVDKPSPTTVAGLSGIAELSAHGYHTCARTAVGAVSCWGWNAYGQLGDATTADKLSPTPVSW